MNAGSSSTQDPFLRASIIATVISLLCISAFAVYFLLENSSSEGIYLLFVPFTPHAIALFLLLRRPAAASITASIWIGALGIIFAVPLAVIGLLAEAFGKTSLLLILDLIYFGCQYMSISMGIDMKRTRRIV